MLKMSRHTAVLVTGFVGLTSLGALAACDGEGLPGNPLCCEAEDFQVGGTISGDYSGEVLVTMQAVADFAGIASAMIDDLTAGCRTIAEELDADAAARQEAEQTEDKRDKLDAYCALAVQAIGTFKAQAGGTLSVQIEPPVCEASISAKANCQASCSGSASCDLQANPPTCEGGKLEVACKGSCTAMGSASVSCEGSCEGECSGECTVEGGTVDCAGRCNGTCMGGTDNQGNCMGQCEGTCEATAAGAECTGTCKGQCEVACQGSADVSVKCDGSCDAEFEPIKCSGGELKGGCEASVECEGNCDASVKAKAECRPPSVSVVFSGAADIEAAGKLKLVLEANLGVVAALQARVEGMFEIATSFAGNVNADILADIKLACIPVVIFAVGAAADDVKVSFEASADLLASVN